MSARKQLETALTHVFCINNLKIQQKIPKKLLNTDLSKPFFPRNRNNMADPELTINIGDAEAAQGLGIGDAIKGRLSDSIQGMDIPSVLQKIIANSGDDEEAEEIKEKLTDVINQYNAMSDEDKNMFTSQIKEALTSKLTMKLKESGALQQIEEAMKNAIWTKLYMVAAGALLLLILIVFFGYKLYKSIKDKEKKREEKKKAKQLKKKK